MISTFGLVASLPSPPSNAIHVGVWIAQRRWSARGGDPHDISRLAVWSVAAGLVGARLYHVITDHQRFEGRWLHTFAIWEGGLGIPGGLIAGVLTGALIALYVAGYALGRLWVGHCASTRPAASQACASTSGSASSP